QRDEDIDMSYEGLLTLSSLLGDVKPRGTPAEIISSLPKGTYGDWVQPGETEERCPICLDDYAASDACMRIPDCSHWFHDGCLQVCLPSSLEIDHLYSMHGSSNGCKVPAHARYVVDVSTGRGQRSRRPRLSLVRVAPAATTVATTETKKTTPTEMANVRRVIGSRHGAMIEEYVYTSIDALTNQ
ncbi:hypothetical protein L226DRAFT_455464, partial [Lentinus tigrinus ALCF2SS1-7]|uniref:uncharacterized protein n=1 Tax=Lentinus tigrinus ALCF2SS1-7 TaxID=1328758 RepID=UPI001165F11E